MPLTIESIGSLTDYLIDRMGTENRILWFRGHRDAQWSVTPSIKRGYDSGDERNFTHRFRSRAGIRHQRLPEYNRLASWLALMQHYGLPTRLLDWSRSPLVALFFALENAWRGSNQNADACVWVLEPHGLNESQGIEPVTAALDAKMYEKHILPAFYHQSEEPNTIAAAMASETDQRMFVQQGCFTIHSGNTSLDEAELPSGVLTKLVIPSHAVRELSFGIEILGFRRGDLFPDLENLSNELRTTYSANGA
jgi:hypothetical protein